jgi:hypothetical protein
VKVKWKKQNFIGILILDYVSESQLFGFDCGDMQSNLNSIWRH